MFTIRVYGILLNEHKQVLVSDEFIRGKYYTKFCGGGLEKGEGTRDCLKREFMEEMGLRVEVKDHLYTTDFYQQSAFNPAHQIISIYYRVEALEAITAPLRLSPFEFDEAQLKLYEITGEIETFRFIDWERFSGESVSLPIDKIVAGLVKSTLEGDDFFTSQLILENERARLEPLNAGHFDFLWPIAQEEEIWRFTSAKVNSKADFKKYFDQALNERNNRVSYPFAIFDKRENRYAGSTRFGNISFENKRLEIGWTWYHPELQRTGLNRACKFLLLRHGFERLGLKRIELKTSSTNEKSRAAIGKIGATQEGILRKHIINDDGSRRDSVLFSIIDDEWPAIKQTIFAGY